MVKRTVKKPVNVLQHKTGWLALVSGIVLVFALGVIAGVMYCSGDAHHHEITTATDKVEIVGSDGLMGLIGYSNPFEMTNSDKINYEVTYKNQSSDDKLIEIKATQRDRVPEQGSEGAVIGAVYSDKAMVKSGESKKFYVTITQTKDDAVQYVELEAFKTK